MGFKIVTQIHISTESSVQCESDADCVCLFFLGGGDCQSVIHH